MSNKNFVEAISWNSLTDYLIEWIETNALLASVNASVGESRLDRSIICIPPFFFSSDPDISKSKTRTLLKKTCSTLLCVFWIKHDGTDASFYISWPVYWWLKTCSTFTWIIRIQRPQNAQISKYETRTWLYSCSSIVVQAEIVQVNWNQLIFDCI